MTGCHFVKKSEDSRDTSFVRVESCLLLHMPFLKSPVHSICGLTCAPQGKNTQF